MQRRAGAPPARRPRMHVLAAAAACATIAILGSEKRRFDVPPPDRSRGGSTLRVGHALTALAMFAALLAVAWIVHDGKAARKPDDMAALAGGPVLRLALDVPAESLAALAADHRAYARATLREGERTYPDIGIRLKGSAGSFKPLEEKPGLTVKINQFVPAQRFHGLRKFVLNNGVQDPSYLCETIGYELWRAAGVPAPRTAHARLSVNGRELGLYILVEAASQDFLAANFEDPSGNLYEGPGEITDELDVDKGGAAADRTDLRALAAAAEESDPAARLARIEKLLDLDRFASFLAVEIITWHWDGYAMASNNYRVYRDPAAKRFVFLPHGADQIFQDPGGPLEPDMQALVADAAMAIPEFRERYRARVAELLHGPAAAGVLAGRIAALAPRVGQALAEIDPGLAEAHAAAVASLAEQVAQRLRSLDDQLAGRAPSRPAPPAEQPAAPPVFDGHGVARIEGWKPRQEAGESAMDVIDDGGNEGAAALHIAAEGEEPCIASWRARVLLPAGRFVLSGTVRTARVAPVDDPDEDPASGVCLRISGAHPDGKLLGDSAWRMFEFEFETAPEGDGEEDAPPLEEKQLVCELRASGGEAWFDCESLVLTRLPSGQSTSEEE